jgi:hypothetical protein
VQKFAVNCETGKTEMVAMTAEEVAMIDEITKRPKPEPIVPADVLPSVTRGEFDAVLGATNGLLAAHDMDPIAEKPTPS